MSAKSENPGYGVVHTTKLDNIRRNLGSTPVSYGNNHQEPQVMPRMG
jgi:hypothetical protein